MEMEMKEPQLEKLVEERDNLQGALDDKAIAETA